MDNTQPRIKILVACHKPDANIRQDDIYMPIQVGKALHPKIDLGFQCDNTGDNISEKNDTYCELTALYWAWKNLKNVDYIGLCHYRRYFDLANIGKKRHILSYITKLDSLALSSSELNKHLSPDSIIVTSQSLYPHSLKIDYCYHHIKEDFDILENVIREDFSNYYPAFDRVINYGNKASLCNMFIMSWDSFDKYCHWLFDVLGKVERQVKLSPYPYQRRVFGFMAERLLNVYLYQNRDSFRIYHAPLTIINYDKNETVKLKPYTPLYVNFKARLNGCRFI